MKGTLTALITHRTIKIVNFGRMKPQNYVETLEVMGYISLNLRSPMTHSSGCKTTASLVVVPFSATTTNLSPSRTRITNEMCYIEYTCTVVVDVAVSMTVDVKIRSTRDEARTESSCLGRTKLYVLLVQESANDCVVEPRRRSSSTSATSAVSTRLAWRRFDQLSARRLQVLTVRRAGLSPVLSRANLGDVV